MSTIKKSKNIYVNNQDFLKAIIQYKKESRKAKRNGEPKPKIPDILGKQLLLIAENLSHKSWFAGYPPEVKGDLIGDGIENCILYFDNFNEKKYKNPFAYFTQIIYFAFRRRIIKERKQLYTKYKYTEHIAVTGELEDSQPNDDGFSQHQFEQYDNINDFIKNFEELEAAKSDKILKKKNVKI